MLETFAHNLAFTLCRYANRLTPTTELHALTLALVTAHEKGNSMVRVDSEMLITLQHDFPILFADIFNSDADAPFRLIDNHHICTQRDYQTTKRIVDIFTNDFSSEDRKCLSPATFECVRKNTLDIWQKVAVFACVYNRITIITGGAGTGKTTTLMHALAILKCKNIVLSAPTGKAVKRMQQALTAHALDFPAKTIHQLLGIREDTATPYFHANRPLDCDVLVIDETSMVGQDVFAFVLDALPKKAKLILLGDDNQLPPVNAAPVFHPLVRQPYTYSNEFKTHFQTCFHSNFPESHHNNRATLTDYHVKLQKTFRFGDAISTLANAILTNNINTLCTNPSVHLSNQIRNNILTAMQVYLDENLPERLLADALPTVLCVMRRGNQHATSDALNAQLDEHIRTRLGTTDAWYVGRKIIIEQNDYDLGVFNGDIGMCVTSDNQTQVIQFDDGRQLAIEDLPSYSLAFALTIHKSQGSEYDNVLIAFTASENADNLLTKDMLYTAITRARKQVTLYSTKTILKHVLQNPSTQDDFNNDLLTILLNEKQKSEEDQNGGYD